MSDLAIGPFQDPQRDARRQERFAQWEAQEKQRDATLLASFRVASQEDPELVGEARRIASKIGIAPELAESNIEVARRMVEERALKTMALQRNNPVLMEQLGRTKFVRVVPGDLENLRSTESTWELMARNWEKGELANELGYIGLRQALGRATPEEIQRADDIDVMIGRQLPGDDGVAAATSEVLGQMSGTLPLSLAAGAGASQLASLGGPISGGAAFALASGATTFSLTGAISAGQSYRSMIRRGIPHERAAVFAFGAGALEGGLETLGQTIALGPIKGLVKGLSKGAAKTLAGDEAKNVFWQFVKDYAKTLGGEVGTEMAQTLSTSLVEDAAASGVEGAKEGEDLGEAMWQTFVKTSKAMAVLSAPGPGLRLMSDLAGAERTQAAMQALNQIEQQAAESKVATRDPETYSETVTAMKERQTGDGSVYVNAVAALEGFRQGDKSESDAGKLARPLIEQAEEAMPGFAARLQEAAARGDDVAIPAGDWAGKLSGTKAGEALKPHVRADVNGLSPMEAKPYLDDPEGAAKEAEKLADDEIKKAEQWDDEAREIERTVAKQVVAAGRNRGDAARGAKLWRSAVEVYAEKDGSTPAEFWKKYGVTVQKSEQAVGVEQKGRASFDPASRVITLKADADFSSFAHETAHALLTIMEDMAAQKLHPSLVDDFRAFLKWAGEDEAGWSGKTLEQKRKAHENFAANFEEYLFDGKAPEPGLRRLFQAFTRFIKRVYGSLVRQRLDEAHREEFGEALLPLSDDIRGVMDRMLASDEKVRTTQAIRGAVPLFQTVEEAVAAGMPADRWIELQRQQQEADDSAASDIERASLRDTKWLRIRIGKLKGEKAQQAKRIREGVRQKVAAEVQAKPVYRAMRWLKTGELVNADGTKTQTDGLHKVATDDVPESLRDDMRGMTVKDGMPADTAAAALGFGDSGKAMVEQIVAAEPIENVIERETDAAMLRDYAELADPARVDAAIEKALHNLARQRFVASELRELTKVGEPLRVLVGAAKLQAEAALAKKPLRDLNPRSFTMAARRASRQAQEAMAAKDVREAIAAKRRHLLQEAMADVAAGIPDEVRKGTASLKQFEKADADLGKKRSIDYVYAGRALAAAYRMRPAPVKGSQEADLIARGLETVKGENPALWERLQPLLAAAERAPIDPKNITLGDFREIVEVSEWLWDAGKAAMELNAEGRRVAMAQAVGDLGGEIAARGPRIAPGASAPEGETATGVGKALLKVWNLFAGLKRMEHWARFMDGGKEGAFHRLFVAPVARALSVYRARQREMVEHYHGILTKAMQASGELWNARIEAKELGFTFKGKKELLGALLHAGSESNLAKLLRGRKGKDGRAWGEMVADGDAETLDTSRWDRTVAGFWKDGTLTKADAEFLTEAWGIYAKLLPQAQKTHKALYGHEFEAIEHRAMDTPHGRLAGGYVPARTDRDAVPPDNRRTADSIAGAEADFRYSISTGKGFTIKRNPNYNQALDLDVGRQLAHFDQELRFIFLQPVVNDAVRITKNREFKAAIEAYDREAIASIIEPWLENVALQTTSRPSGMPFIDWGATVLRNAASIASLGFNVANSLVQITGISNALSQVRGDYMRSALGTWTKNPVEAKRVAEAKSPYMAQRSDVQVRIWREQIDRATAPGVGKALRQTLSRWAFAPQRFVQGVADVVTWQGGYAQAVAEGKTEQAAIESADSAVRRSQGSQNAEDVAKYESSTPFVKLFTQFGSYSNLVLNQVIGAQGLGGKASAAAWAILLPAIAEATMRLAWTGAPEDKDANGTVDEWFAHYLRGVGRNVAGLIPAGGPMLLSLATTEGERTLEAPGTAIIRQFVSGLFATAEFFAEGGDETSAAEARDIATMLSAATGLPLAAPVRTAQQLTGATR